MDWSEAKETSSMDELNFHDKIRAAFQCLGWATEEIERFVQALGDIEKEEDLQRRCPICQSELRRVKNNVGRRRWRNRDIQIMRGMRQAIREQIEKWSFATLKSFRRDSRPSSRSSSRRVCQAYSRKTHHSCRGERCHCYACTRR